MRCRLAAAALATGCLSVPPYAPEVAVTYTEASTGSTAAGPGFALHFAGGDGFHFPDALLVDGIDVMGREPMPGCFDQDEAGILFLPTSRLSAHGSAPRVTNRLEPVLRGPAVVQVKLTWATRFDCNLDRTPVGTARFTVFPDGRIVRHDTIADPSTSPIYANDECTCAPPGPGAFTVTTFWTLARSKFQQLHAPDPEPLPGPTDTVNTNLSTACIDNGRAYQVAFGWRESEGMSVRSSDSVIGFGRDLVFGTSRLDDFSWENSTAIIIERSGCDAADTRADEHAFPSTLKIDGVATTTASRDGIYGGDSGNGEPGFPLAATHAELVGPVRSSFAVWLRFPGPVDGLRATRADATGPWYLPQRVDDRSWIIWFRDSISAAQKITIDAI